MSLDGLFTHALVQELNRQFQDSRIHKIQQPYDEEVILTIRANRKNYKLLLSVHSQFARVQITNENYVNPDTPPNFCMVLRKFVEGNRILSIQQYENDRIICFNLERKNEIGDFEEQQIIIELMGRHSNIFLLSADNSIIDCIKHVPIYQNSFRTLLPGVQYQLPPQGNQVNPWKASFLPNALPSLDDLSAKDLQKYYMGIGRDSAKEILSMMKGENDRLRGLEAFLTRFDHLQPTLTINDEGKTFFTPFPFQTLSGDKSTFPSLSDLLQAYFETKAKQDHIKQVGSQLVTVVSREIKKNKHKLNRLQDDLNKSQQADAYQLRGELLTTYLYQMTKGQSEITVNNYYDDDKPLTIALDPTLTPSQNAQHYFHKYNKLTDSITHIHEQMAKTKAELSYLESVDTQIQLAEPQELNEIKDELIHEGYLKKQKQKRSHKNKRLKPRHFTTQSGTSILVGRNNRQNDELTMRKANKNHYWFHTKDIPGSHVILMTDNPSDEDIVEAAQLAAKYSKYAQSTNVPVDYTQVKDVKKPNGAKPGFVNYFNQQTVFVTPNR
ncbi:MAG: NFACT RNA binding domain-containing protein [Aerococcus suis]|nr:NFACT RNA binding domain-containing protein [Aerococcus suis]